MDKDYTKQLHGNRTAKGTKKNYITLKLGQQHNYINRKPTQGHGTTLDAQNIYRFKKQPLGQNKNNNYRCMKQQKRHETTKEIYTKQKHFKFTRLNIQRLKTTRDTNSTDTSKIYQDKTTTGTQSNKKI